MVFITLFLFSCEALYFSRPQPIDEPDLKKFPSLLKGSWYSENDGLRIIDKKGIRMIVDDTGSQDISKRWVETRYDEAGNETAQHLHFIRYDSSKQAYDTSLEIILQDGLAFGVDIEKNLETGYPYEIKDSVLYYHNKDTVYYDLGNNILLRKLDAKHYALNIRNTVVGKGNSWWQLVIIEAIDSKNIVYYYGLKEKPDKITPHPIQLLYKRGDAAYLNVNWTKKMILDFLEKDYFDRADSLWKIQ